MKVGFIGLGLMGSGMCVQALFCIFSMAPGVW